MPRKPQTEEKAKGLIGLSKGKKVAGASQSVGNYKGRTLNLTRKQIAQSGVKGARKAAAAKATSISDTKFEKGKGVTKGGKAFSGNVDLGGGNVAVYVNGRRVRASSKASRPSAPPPPPPPRRAAAMSASSAERLRKANNADRATGGRQRPGPAKPGEYQAGRGMISSRSSDYRGNSFPVRGGAAGYVVTGKPEDRAKAQAAARSGTAARTFQTRRQITDLRRELAKLKRMREQNAATKKDMANIAAELRRLESQLAGMR